MVAKCANPRCHRRFRYASEGKLFIFGRNSLEKTLWLCAECATAFELTLDAESNPVLASRPPRTGERNISMEAGAAGEQKTEASFAEERKLVSQPDAGATERTLVEWTADWLERWSRPRQAAGLPALSAELPQHRDKAMEWSAGAVCRRTGVYAVEHDEHRPTHQAIVWESETFPTCRKCGMEVSFRFCQLLEASGDAEHIGYDRDFMESMWGLAPGATA